MKKLILLLALVFIFTGCSDKITAYYDEQNDLTNDDAAGAENTGFSGSHWYEIQGTISSINDKDYFYVDIPDTTDWISLSFSYTGVEDEDNLKFFHFHILEYDGGSESSHYFLAETGRVNMDFSSPDYVYFVIMGTAAYPSGGYTIQFRAGSD